ncbi:hypothetical protein BDZ89DRAFT_1069632 [Hymenopellis radicata]|nr:hypothetical protein BDZ89DRAFT_1069632 [Hymenopellis radicata]
MKGDLHILLLFFMSLLAMVAMAISAPQAVPAAAVLPLKLSEDLDVVAAHDTPQVDVRRGADPIDERGCASFGMHSCY